ncbi:protein FAR1-RELATED SEQUENCE 5-like [Silene latifolia]|uniref:protein FAR1-RELATED SEQUENCE 5-like n=1 Tax=Silene latifolia TaxID=37657 RepID=UPI003D77CF90
MDSDSTENNMRAESRIVNPVHSMPIVQHHSNAQPNNQLVLSHTPNGSERWIRVVESKFRPTICTVFSSLEAGIKFYGVYARACGFTPRKYTTKKLRGGIAHQKFIVCNRQGFRGNKQKLRYSPVPKHNNGDSSSTVETLKGELKSQELAELILDNSKLNIGAGKTFRQVKELVYGYENIGATLVNFKNFQRDIKCYIGERDADIFLDRLEKLKATQTRFYFAYDVVACNCLTRVFWADSKLIRNYSFFGDAVSFDPTYGTNKYDMVFTPFTGVNHHRKSVFFATYLLSHEDEESFKWTF